MRVALALVTFVLGAFLAFGLAYIAESPGAIWPTVGAILMVAGAATLASALLWRRSVDTAVTHGRPDEAHARRQRRP